MKQLISIEFKMNQEQNDFPQKQTRQELQKSEHSNKTIESEHKNQYNQFFQDQPLTQKQIASLIQILYLQEKIIYSPLTFQKNILIKIDQFRSTEQIFYLDVSLGYFRMNLTIYHEPNQSSVHYCPNKSNCKYVNIFLTRLNDTNQAIKCFEYNEKETIYQVFGKALKQCIFIKIASGLGVGPKFTKYTGFDMIIYDSCVEFSMERCSQINLFEDEKIKNEALWMKKKLQILHSFNIIHFDIKPSNIMMSKQSNKLLFVDFGLSRMIEQKIGFKSQTNFAGSLSYCSLELKKAFADNEQTYHFIDLYYNDVHCLAVSLRQIDSHHQKRKQSINEEVDYFDIIEHYVTGFNKQLSKSRVVHDYLQRHTVFKLKNLIFLGKNQVLAYKTRAILNKNAIQFFKFIACHFPFKEILVDVFNYLKSATNYQEQQQACLISLFQKKQKLLKCKHSDIEQTTKFLQKLQIQSSETTFTFEINTQQISILIEDKQKQTISNLQLISEIPRALYYFIFTKKVDLRANYSTFQQKKCLSTLFLEVNKIKPTNTLMQSQHQDMSACFKLILNHFIEFQQENFEFVLPASFINLIILETLPIEEIKILFKRIVRVKRSFLKKIFMLFRCFFVGQWINFKIFSKYSEPQLQLFFIKTVLQQLCPLTSIELKMNFGSDQQQNSCNLKELKTLKECLLQCMNYFYENKQKFDKQMVQEIMAVSIFQMRRKQLLTNSINIATHLVNIIQKGGSMFSHSNKIDFIHLKLLQNCQSASSEILTHLCNKIISCFQSSNIAQTLKFYYYPQNILWKKLDSNEKLNILLNICSSYEKCKYSSAIIVPFYKLLLQKKINDTTEEYQKITNIFNLDYLQSITFPKDCSSDNILTFYLKIIDISFLFFKLHKSESKELICLKQLINKLQNHCHNIECKFCKEQCYHSLLKMKIRIWMDNKDYQSIFSVCSQEISILSEKQKKICLQKGETINSYLQIIVILLRSIPIEQKNNQLSTLAFNIIKNNRIYQFVLIGECGETLYYFISQFSLFEIDEISEYLLFHKHLIDFIYLQYSRQYSQIYVTYFQHFITTYSFLMAQKSKKIVDFYFESYQRQMRFLPNLFLSFLLKFIDEQSKFFLKTVILICKQGNVTPVYLRRLIFQKLFSFLLKNHPKYFNTSRIGNFVLKVSNKRLAREKRHKIMKILNYCTIKISFNNFIKHLQLIPLKKKAKQCKFNLKLYENIKKMYKMTLK